MGALRIQYDRATKRISTRKTGAFTQYPIRLAWAVTIHKSQGKTFDRVVIDIGRGAFAHGQVYVALSRCTNFAGITLAQEDNQGPHPHGLEGGAFPHEIPVQKGR